MFQYCYTFSYDHVASPTFHVRVYALAEKYFIKELAVLAKDRFMVAGTALYLQPALLRNITSAITEAQATVYEQGNILRIAIADLVVLKEDLLLNNACPEFDALMEKHPSLAADVARALAKAMKAYKLR